MRMRDSEGHAAMLAAGKAWKRVDGVARQMWTDWTTKIGPGLVKARAEAMAIASTNKPEGKGYSMAMSGLLEEYGFGDTEEERRNGAAARADLLKCMEHLSEIEIWRAKQRDLSGLNHPTIVWRHFKQSKEGKAIVPPTKRSKTTARVRVTKAVPAGGGYSMAQIGKIADAALQPGADRDSIIAAIQAGVPVGARPANVPVGETVKAEHAKAETAAPKTLDECAEAINQAWEQMLENEKALWALHFDTIQRLGKTSSYYDHPDSKDLFEVFA